MATPTPPGAYFLLLYEAILGATEPSPPICMIKNSLTSSFFCCFLSSTSLLFYASSSVSSIHFFMYWSLTTPSNSLVCFFSCNWMSS